MKNRMAGKDFQIELRNRTNQVQEIVYRYLPKKEGFQKTASEAMNYAVRVGGKRLRPLIMQETFRLFSGEGKEIEPFMAAIEMIHNYSLIHDDLPAMDNDEFRRGKKTTHIVYGEAMGILAGDGLLNLAFETAANVLLTPEVSADPVRMRRCALALSVLGKKSGLYGMLGGQSVDVEAEKEDLKVDGPMLEFIHANKTAGLIQAAMMCGAILAGAESEDVSVMESIGYDVGLAFQIQDDILDVTGDEMFMGKPVGSDEKNNKTTYVSLYGVEGASARQWDLSSGALRKLSAFKNRNVFLEELVRSLITRKY